MGEFRADHVVFNIVWTGQVFDHLGPLVASQIRNSDARFRFLVNACPSGQIAAMAAFSGLYPDRVVEVLEVSRDRMIPHGAALDIALRTRDDGDVFAFMDPDIYARGPFLERFLTELELHDAVTSGSEVWSHHNVKPADHPGVNGEYFFDADGFVFGSPHLALYRRSAVLGTVGRWGIGLASKGNDLSSDARARLVEFGRSYWVYDTAKVLNILLQADGHDLVHIEHEHLVHIGGVSHFLAPPSTAPAAQDEPPAWGEGPDWGEQAGQAVRYEVARYTAEMLAALLQGRSVPPVPMLGDPSLRELLHTVRTDLMTVVAGHQERRVVAQTPEVGP